MRARPSAAVAVPAVVGLGVLMAAASHTSVWAPARSGVADPVWLLTILAGAFAVCAAGAGALSLALRRDPRRWAAGTIVAASALSLLVISRAHLRPEAAPGAEASESGEVREGVRLESDWRGPAVRRPGEEEPESAGGASFEGVRIFRRLVLAVGALALALLLFLRRSGALRHRSIRLEAPGAAERSAAHGAVVGSIEAMLADPNPRTAIIGAYARLQEELEGSGASRRAYEGPTEHLHRALSMLDVRAAPLERLIGLFEIARFSDHSLTASHRDAALSALREVAADLVGPEAAAGEVVA